MNIGTGSATVVSVLLYVVVVAVFLYALYYVVRAAVRDGIRLARERDSDEPRGGGPH
ncbi:hypothetical protein JHE00_04405 [Prauserella sp. ASG 168]|uniref:Uncharacterized protein n=1 Tax=Prauserella cavernicola TaxID=2800127 RepID=A0A934QPB3_9PSEU|nr:hypothetical protein [Prauserella cavernicola]MBK1783558.1 hypothetical protein [Prauserella cavernicola]